MISASASRFLKLTQSLVLDIQDLCLSIQLFLLFCNNVNIRYLLGKEFKFLKICGFQLNIIQNSHEHIVTGTPK